MRLFSLLVVAATATLALAGPVPTQYDPGPLPDSIAKRYGSRTFRYFGVNEAGPEFGSKVLPGKLGKEYTWPSRSSIDTIDYITRSKGAFAIIDPHNYGRYKGARVLDVAGFQTFWRRLAGVFATNPKVLFDTNNEYHDMDQHLVVSLNQAAINGIRSAGATRQPILVEGNSYSGAWTWMSSGNGASLLGLTDPSNNIIYHMHQYLDQDGSGTHSNCVSPTIGAERIAVATKWLKDHGKKGILGEYAVGNNPTCRSALKGMLRSMAKNADVWTGAVWWGGGPWFNNYMFSMEPPHGVAYVNMLPMLLSHM